MASAPVIAAFDPVHADGAPARFGATVAAVTGVHLLVASRRVAAEGARPVIVVPAPPRCRWRRSSATRRRGASRRGAREEAPASLFAEAAGSPSGRR
jgi:hypothetical protein